MTTSDDKKVTLPSKRIDSNGNERDMESPYEMGGYYCTIGLAIHENPYPQSDEFNYRRFLDGYLDRRGGVK